MRRTRTPLGSFHASFPRRSSVYHRPGTETKTKDLAAPFLTGLKLLIIIQPDWMGFRRQKLIFYSIDTNFDASTTDGFRKHCGKRRNCS